MLSGDLQSRLQKLNPRLFIYRDKVAVEGEWKYSGIYLREAGKKKTMARWKWNYADTNAQKYLQDVESGTSDKFLCGVCLTAIPEYDIFNFEQGLVRALGWRSIVLSLAKRNAIDIRKARRVFSMSSLGLQTYDHMPLEQKLQWVCKEN